MIRQMDTADVFPGVRLLKVPEAASALNVSRAHIYALMERGELKYTKLGRARRIPVAAIDELIETQTTGGKASGNNFEVV